ncbi:hypothetical protein FSP39_012188 [Pinctada imbricata]|uniref:Amine oxidase n=1 Tax=Pinctada imbricata TaxID=66713 RepID=A0AA89C598_PINIB|nr:hypothetical protein FSP39_012188 [Pinctada imbricata]
MSVTETGNGDFKSFAGEGQVHPDLRNNNVKRETSTTWKICIYLIISIVIFTAGLIIGYFVGNYLFGKIESSDAEGGRPNGTTTSPFLKWEGQSVFAPLSVEEHQIVKERVLLEGLIRRNNSIYRPDDYLLYDLIYDIHVHYPNKTRILEHLDNGGKFPGRFAMVYLYQGSLQKPAFTEYVVGPLERDLSKINVVLHRRLTGPTFNKRPKIPRETVFISKLARKEFKVLDPLLKVSVDGLVYGYNETLDMALRETYAILNTNVPYKRASRAYLTLTNHLDTLDMIPVTAIVHHDTLNASEWSMDNFYYYGQGPFSNASHLMESFRKGILRVVKFPEGYVKEISKKREYLQNKTEPLRQKANLRPSITYAPESPRYTIKGHIVEWMGWSFELSANSFRGPSIFNVKFKNKRILYEHSLNELNLLYSSSTVGGGFSNIVMSDIAYKLGNRMSFIRGVDCPEYASIVNASTWIRSRGRIRPTFCVFEVDGQRALWRHSGAYYSAGLRDHFLAVRAPANLGNYDYTLEFEFHMDGKMGTYVTSSGIVYGSFWYEGGDFGSNTPFGYRVAERAIGSVHDHTFAFKVDFDLIDTQNSFEFIDWKSGSMEQAIRSQQNSPKNIPEYDFNSTRYVEYRPLTKEQGFHVTTNPTFWTIVNNKHRNKWGNKRGYSISHTSQEYIDVLPSDHPALKALPQLKYSCAITKRKDEEPYASYSNYDLSSLNYPLENLDTYMDNENVEDTDIVA